MPATAAPSPLARLARAELLLRQAEAARGFLRAKEAVILARREVQEVQALLRAEAQGCIMDG